MHENQKRELLALIGEFASNTARNQPISAELCRAEIHRRIAAIPAPVEVPVEVSAPAKKPG